MAISDLEQEFMLPLWSWRELCAALDLRIDSGPDIAGIDFDSRTIGPNELFLALLGDPGPRFNVAQRTNRDGHDFVASAQANGAVAALVHRDVDCSIPTLKVPDTIEALWELARYRRDQLRSPVAAVTGSSGKTTLKSFLSQALGAFATTSSYNNYIGAPLSMALTPRSATAAVVEIGTNHEGEIAPLSEVINPDIAVVLNVLPVHIGNFKSIDELRAEKLSIVSGLKPGSTLIVHESLRDYVVRTRGMQVLTFGTTPVADVQVDSADEVNCDIKCDGQSISLAIPGGGMHRAETLAATAAVAVALDMSLDRLNRIASELPPGRGNVVSIGSVSLIDESYNANPSSVRAALEHLLQHEGRTIAVIGQMNELGDQSDRYHELLADVASKPDVVYCVGEQTRPLHEALSDHSRFFPFADSLLETDLVDCIQEGDTVLVKGSHSVFWEVNFVRRLEIALRAKYPVG